VVCRRDLVGLSTHHLYPSEAFPLASGRGNAYNQADGLPSPTCLAGQQASQDLRQAPLLRTVGLVVSASSALISSFLLPAHAAAGNDWLPRLRLGGLDRRRVKPVEQALVQLAQGEE
jgi:hypothetical protein